MQQAMLRTAQCWGPKRTHWCFLLAFNFCFGEAEEGIGIAEKCPWFVCVQMSMAYTLGASYRVFCLLRSGVELLKKPAFLGLGI